VTIPPDDAPSSDRAEERAATPVQPPPDGVEFDHPEAKTDENTVASDAEAELEAQRRAHAPAPDTSATERADDGLAPLINNTGDDGGAATG
jgi:hypothetical protein